MKRYYPLLMFLVVLISNNLQAILVEVHRVRGNDGREFDFFSDIHVQPNDTIIQADKQQIEILKKRLIEYDDENDKRVEVFIEATEKFCRYSKSPTVTSYLITALQKLRLQRTVCKDVEIRRVSWAALYIFEKECIPYMVCGEYKLNVLDKFLAIEEMTFKDLVEEFDTYFSFLTQVKKNHGRAAEDLFDEKLRLAQEEFESLKDLLSSNKVRLETKMLRISILLAEMNRNDIRGSFYMNIRRAFGDLLDLYAFNQMLSAQDANKIIFIGGGDHARSLRSMMLGLGYKWLFSHYGPHQSIENPIPVPEKHLTIFAKPPSWWDACTIL